MIELRISCTDLYLFVFISVSILFIVYPQKKYCCKLLNLLVTLLYPLARQCNHPAKQQYEDVGQCCMQYRNTPGWPPGDAMSSFLISVASLSVLVLQLASQVKPCLDSKLNLILFYSLVLTRHSNLLPMLRCSGAGGAAAAADCRFLL